MIHALQVLFWVAAALAASVAKGPHKVANPLELEELVPSLTQQEIQFLEGDPIITHKIVFLISQKGETIEQLGDLSIGLFGLVVPKTVENFVHLSNMTYGFGYQNLIFHRVIKNFMIQGGDFEHSRGTGGYSIFEKGKFPDENFELKHSKLGRLSMANSGPNTNGAQFFVTNIEKCDWLDGRHVVFGQVIGGFDTLHRISNVPTAAHDKPAQDIVISSISVIPLSKMAPEGQAVAEPVQPISPQETPVFVVEKEGTGFYVYFFVVLLVGGCFFYYNHWYHRKQYITDIKDSAYF